MAITFPNETIILESVAYTLDHDVSFIFLKQYHKTNIMFFDINNIMALIQKW